MLRKHVPVPKTEMLVSKPYYTICETLRQAYIKSKNEEVKYLLRVATSMAKSMQNRLIKHNDGMKNYDWNKTDEMDIRHTGE